MALETLKGVEKIGGFRTKEIADGCMVHRKVDGAECDGSEFVIVDLDLNAIMFTLQNGPVKENGLNGCQADTLISAAKLIIEGLNSKFPCRENACAITKLDEALHWLDARKRNRIERGVEGKSEA